MPNNLNEYTSVGGIPQGHDPNGNLLNDGAFEIGYWRRVQQGTTAQGRKQKPVVTGFEGFKVVTRQVDPLVRLAK